MSTDDPESQSIIQDVLRTLLRGNSDAVATKADWSADGCRVRSDDGAKCAIEVPHPGTPHRFCRRQPHGSPCVAACYWDEA